MPFQDFPGQVFANLGVMEERFQTEVLVAGGPSHRRCECLWQRWRISYSPVRVQPEAASIQYIPSVELPVAERFPACHASPIIADLVREVYLCPHMHNVLKEIRALSTAAADRLMLTLDLHIPDPQWRISGDPDSNFRDVPLLRSRIGPGTDAVLTEIRGHFQLPQSLLKGLVDPITARLGPDLVLPKSLAAHDLVLLDQNPRLREAPGAKSTWVVSEGAGLRIRYLRMDGARLCVANEVTLRDPRQWHSIPLSGRNILDIVRARIVWISREMEKDQD
jgi:hypothetical protein